MLTGTFKTFPQFTRLTIAHRREYERLIRDFPPISDIAFATLMIWWNFLDSCAVSQLNDNLVISYWLPGDEKNSGLSIVGTKNIDESACIIFDQQRKQGKPMRLVHVPELVASSMRYPELFRFIGERDYDECVVSVDSLYPLNHAPASTTRKINKFLSATAASKVVLHPEDLRLAQNRQIILDKATLWRSKSTLNGNAKWFASQGVAFINFEQDLGLQILRAHRLALGPSNFFRKYIVEPA